MDTPGTAQRPRFLKFCLVACLLASSGLSAPVQPPACATPEETIERLADQHDWSSILSVTTGLCPSRPAYLDFYRGLALAALGRPAEAIESFRAAVRKSPRQGRYRVELAGALFLEKRWTDARKALLPAFNLPCQRCDESYLNDFLATLYYLEGNTLAALKYWNRIGKPVLHDLRVSPEDFLRSEILHSAIAFSSGDTLTLSSLRETMAVLEDSRLVSRQFVRLLPRPDKEYDLELVTLPKSGTLSRHPLRSAVLLGRDLPFETVHLSLRNPNGSGLSWQSMVRWDERDSRVSSLLTGPLSGQLDQLFSLEIDLRREAWRLPVGTGLEALSSTDRRLALSAGFSSRVKDRWKWTTGAEMSWRSAEDPPSGTVDNRALRRGRVLEYGLGLERAFLYLPEHGFSALASVELRTARFWSTDSHAFGQLEGQVKGRWSLDPNEDRTIIEASFHAGTTKGTVPFDKLYHLGIDRDNVVAFRGHPTKKDGVYGAGPWGERYWLGRADLSRRLYQRPFFSVMAGPFVDIGRVASGPAAVPDHRRVLVDLGIQTRIRLAYSLDVYFTVGVDARRGDVVPFVRTGQ